MYLYQSDATLTGNQISGNTASGDYSTGGGLYLSCGDATLTNNTIVSNTANSGGGMSLSCSNATLMNNTIVSNTANSGGGLHLSYSGATLTGNRISGNAAHGTHGYGGGLYLDGSDNATLTGNTVSGNTASFYGGGLYLNSSDATLTNNTVVSNTASNGGGLYLYYHSDADLQNDIIADNVASNGGGLYVRGSSLVLRHLTLARNQGNAGVYVTGDHQVGYGHVVLTDTLLVSHTVGLSVAAGNTAMLQATLWGSGAWANGADWSGAGGITTGTVNVWGDPAFINPNAGDYHILSTSAAVDAGVDAGVMTDIDGDPRPAAFGYDIGADEVLNGPALQPIKDTAERFYNAGETVTYAIHIPNNGITTARGVRITDTLPAAQRPLSVTTSSTTTCTVNQTWGGSVVCGPMDVPTDTTIFITLTAQITTVLGSAALPMENHLEARGSNAAAAAALRLYLQDCHVRINDGTTEYHSVQQAVDAAATGDLIEVAGLCADIHTRSGVNQVVYISKTVTIRGGYSTDFNTWNPAQYTTTLDAMGAGRVLYITGNVTPTVEGLHLTRGDATGLGGGQWGGNAGGGVYVVDATAAISNCHISGNTAVHFGGGLYLCRSSAILTGNRISGNTASWNGGGLYLFESNADLQNDIVADNVAGNDGGGLYVRGSSPVLRHLTLARNRGSTGIYVNDYYWDRVHSHVVMTNTLLVSHTVGLSVAENNTATLQATLWGSGAWANGTDYTGAGSITTGTVNVWDDPRFVNPDAGDYHILPTSAAVDAGVDAGVTADAAVDAGVDAGVTADIDGDARPYGNGYDMGADEFSLCPHPLSGVSISGPTSGYTDTAYVFAAAVSPANASTPITYTWTPAPTAGSGAQVTYTWATTGTHVITVRAENCGGVVTVTHTIVISARRQYEVYLPMVLRQSP